MLMINQLVGLGVLLDEVQTKIDTTAMSHVFLTSSIRESALDDGVTSQAHTAAHIGPNDARMYTGWDTGAATPLTNRWVWLDWGETATGGTSSQIAELELYRTGAAITGVKIWATNTRALIEGKTTTINMKLRWAATAPNDGNQTTHGSLIATLSFTDGVSATYSNLAL